MTDRPQHLFEIEPRKLKGRGYVGAGMAEAATTRSSSATAVTGAKNTAEFAAHQLLDKCLDVDSVGIYHTYPSPGPVRRYCGEVTR